MLFDIYYMNSNDEGDLEKFNINVGDLVFLDVIDVVGIIVEIKKFSETDIDAEVYWRDGERFWCLAEGLTVLSRAKK